MLPESRRESPVERSQEAGNINTRCAVQLVIAACDRCAISPWRSENLYGMHLRTASLMEGRKKSTFPWVSLLRFQGLSHRLSVLLRFGFWANSLCRLPMPPGRRRYWEGGWRGGASAWGEACPGHTCAKMTAAHMHLVTVAVAECEARALGGSRSMLLENCQNWPLESHICGWKCVVLYLIYMWSAFLLPPAIIGCRDSKWADS